jgi:hypothetical protein
MMNPATKKILKLIAGILLIIIGVLALITPFTPGSWLAFVGLELIGVRIAFWQKIKDYIFKKKNNQNPTSNDQSNLK